MRMFKNAFGWTKMESGLIRRILAPDVTTPSLSAPGQRGYAMTRAHSFLDSYYGSLSQPQQDMNDFRQLTDTIREKQMV